MSFDALAALLTCPACGSSAGLSRESDDELACPDCGTRFPLLACGDARIPWLFSDPAVARIEWRARLQAFDAENAAEQRRLRAALDARNASKTARKRIVSALDGRDRQRQEIHGLLRPLFGKSAAEVTAADKLFGGLMPRQQGLTTYLTNVFRDWAWENGENEQLFAGVEAVMACDVRDGPGTVLTLGSGAGRLTYDFHRRFRPELSLSLDLNPLLLLAGARAVQGDAVLLHEFPIAPLDGQSAVRAQRCAAPEALDAGNSGRFHFLLADAMVPPLRPGSIDTLFTPWLIDIIPRDLADYVRCLNALLKPGGVWINTGSLAFEHHDERWRYSPEETLALIEHAGFELLGQDRRTVQYLQSPLSAHGRTESVLSFAVRKTGDCPAPRTFAHQAEWLLDTSLPVPAPTMEMAVASSQNLLKATVFSLVDGKRSIDEIGAAIAQRFGTEPPQAVQAARSILDEFDGRSR